MTQHVVFLTPRNVGFAAFGGLIMLTALVYVNNHKHSQESQIPAALITAPVDESAPDLGTSAEVEKEAEVAACPWKKQEFTRAMCREWKTKRSITYKGEMIVESFGCGVVPRESMVTFSSCEDSESHEEVRLLYTKGQWALLTVDPHAKKPLCDAVLLAKKNHRELRFSSSYRSFAEQVSSYCGQFSKTGHAPSSQAIATPGYSNHGFGATFDVFLFDDQGNQLTFDNSEPRHQTKKEDADQLSTIMAASGFTLTVPRSNGWCFTYQPANHAADSCPPPPTCHQDGNGGYCDPK